jgi:Flp pilus assembly protein TadG
MNFLAKLKRAHINTITAQNWITYSNVFLEKRDKIPTNFGAMERIKIHVLPNYIYVNFMLILCQPRAKNLGTGNEINFMHD